jgi:hypothetical protein
MLAFPMQDADGWTPASRRPVPLPTNDHACLDTCLARTRLAAGQRVRKWGRKIHGDRAVHEKSMSLSFVNEV